ncbi:MAG: hypothetical protein UY13_C0002G0355 [Candidatus Pacebacteria bacterium GW2011_GWB1_47_8]|nr:MAG: hypothetical protein UX28_C0001G0503 [Candidatus Pacebacteria bacterium GW2011_GWA1_46_10]KKU84443.1 MAG: hypothetical protein UY13_C0002G0355 [Candidatus Pacebacteria bacterium GW2011_GWB1_47_8]HCR81125.1 hypothetical protein [Candidatus Paceibacterota bacterium]
MKKLIAFYYGLLILVLASQAIYTVYKLGGTVGQGEKLGLLQQQQQTLSQQLQVLRETYSRATALTPLAETVETDYQPIQKPIILTVSSSVASR